MCIARKLPFNLKTRVLELKGEVSQSSSKAMEKRPPGFQGVLYKSPIVYVAYTRVNNEGWTRGLFAAREILKGELIGVYDGVILSSREANSSTSEYLMTMRDPKDLRKRLTIDGDPSKTRENIVAFANYAKQEYANANFIDETKKGDSKPTVAMRACRRIEQNCELRVDYDMGSAKTPFLDKLVQNGVPLTSFDGKYLTKRYF